jgi:PKD repeat protein
LKLIPLLVFVSLLAAGLILIPNHDARATPTYDYLVDGVDVKGSDGVTVVHTAATFAAACTWALTHTNTITYIPAGSYTVTASIVMTSYTTLISDGILTADAATHYMLTASSKNHLTITGGEWDGNKGGRVATDMNTIIYLLSCTTVSISDLDIHDGPVDNIVCESCSYVTLSDSDSYDPNGNCCAMNFCSNCIIEDNHLYDAGSGSYFYCEDDGIVQHVDNNIIRRNTVERTQLSGLSISLRGIEDTGYGNLIENNTCIDCGMDGDHPGINLGWSGATEIRYATSCIVINNEVYQTGTYDCGDGMDMQCKSSTINYNDIHDIEDAGINLRGNANTISHNTIDDVVGGAYPGIEVWDGNYNRIMSNQISHCAMYGIWLVKDLTSGCNCNYIAANTISSITGYCIYLQDVGSTQNILEGNSLSGTYQFHDGGTSTQNFGLGLGHIGVWGTKLELNGLNISSTFQGFDETTALTYAIDAYVNGHTQYWGKNMNFPVPDTGQLQVTSLSELWYAYFWFAAHYNMQSVRIGVADIWSTGIFYNAWKNHPTQFFQVLDEMLHQASDRGIYVYLVLAGSQEYPVYSFGGSGSVFTHSHTTGTAYQNFYLYEKAVIQHFNSSAYNSMLMAIDTWNEPDHTSVVAGYWGTNKAAFHTWATAVASDLTPQSPHIVDMGIGGVGDNLFYWGSSDFTNYIVNCGFDVVQRHYYAANSDHNNFDSPHSWATSAGKCLIWGEVGNNSNYPYIRWTYAETHISYNHDGAWFSMVMRGTTGYPYTGSYPIGETPTPPPTPAPSISINSNKNSGVHDLTVSFTSSVINGVAPFTYAWTFGDGGASTSASPSHTYTAAGSFSVHATVSGGGTGSSNTLVITVTNPADPLPPAPPAPTITISADHSSGSGSLTVHFLSTVSNGQAPFTYSWVFGDGGTSTSANPTHTYSTGTFSAHATVNGGGTDVSNYLTISVLVPASNDPNGSFIIVNPPAPSTNITGNSSLDDTMGVFSMMLPAAVIISIFGFLLMAVTRRP